MPLFVGTEIVPVNAMDPAAITDKNFGVPMRSSWGKQFYWLCKRYNLHCTYFMDFESIRGNSYC